jgi:hypothetical protein
MHKLCEVKNVKYFLLENGIMYINMVNVSYAPHAFYNTIKPLCSPSLTGSLSPHILQNFALMYLQYIYFPQSNKVSFSVIEKEICLYHHMIISESETLGVLNPTEQVLVNASACA